MNVYIEVYGCTANKSDESLIIGLLKKNNYTIVRKISDADIIIILTCTVIDTTEQRMISRLNRLKKTEKTIIITGCMASIQSFIIKSILPSAKIIPPQYIYHIIDILKEDKVKYKKRNKTGFPKYYDKIFAPISISEGCLFSCTYCITSVARGKLSSYPINEISDDVYSALNQGCKEIQLTSQDTASYGLDTNNNLGNLLKTVSRINSDFKIRVGMMNPYTALINIDSILIGFKSSKVYKFLHLPVQSGDNLILKKMNRKYSIEDFFQIVRRFREKFIDLSLSTDIIVGFPSETDDQFRHSVDLIERINPDIVNITRYSARPFTKAKVMRDRVSTDIVKKRSKIISEICNKIAFNNNLKYLGKTYNVLITEIGKNNTYLGRNKNYKQIVIKEKVTLGAKVNVEITDTYQNYLVGMLI